MINRNSFKAVMQSLLLTIIGVYSNTGLCGLSADSIWLVEKGDNVYQIARKVFPDDVDKQRQFRKELVTSNPDVFKNNANLIHIGDRLMLPAFAVSKPVVTAVPDKSVAIPAVVEKPVPPESMPVAAEVVTPVDEAVVIKKEIVADPEDVIGHVVISVGKMQASNRGVFRKLLRHSEVLRGDTLSTSKSAYTQIRMKDGALLSLRPNTQLKITDYRFSGSEDGTERSIMELVSGGFRTITGLIGHRNKQNYRVKTAVATIGIRGTHYALMICEKGSCSGESDALEDGVYGGVVDGSIVVENETGSTTFNNDQYFHVASSVQKPVEQLTPPPVFHGKNEKRARIVVPKKLASVDKKRPAVRRKTVRGDRLGSLVKAVFDDKRPPVVFPDQTSDTIPKVAVKLAPKGSGLLLAFNANDPLTGIVDTIAAGVRVGDAQNAINLDFKVSASGAVAVLPVEIRENSNLAGDKHQLVLPSGVTGIKDVGGHVSGVYWGRWSDAYVFTQNGTTQKTFSDLHFIYSEKLTRPTELAVLSQPATLGGLTAAENYTLVGSTTPTDRAGLPATLLSLNVVSDFVNQKIALYQVAVSDSVGQVNFAMDASNIPFAQMSEFTLNPVNCNPGCTGSAGAAFVGNRAQGLMTTYSIQDTAATNGINGAAFLTRDSAPAVAAPF